VVSPFLFLWKAIELILWDQKIQVTDNFLKTDADLKRLFIYHTFNIVKQLFTTEFQTIYPRDPIDDPLGITSRDVQIITNVEWGIDTFQYKDCLPKMGLGDFLLSLQNKLNIIFDFDGLDEVRIIDRESVLKAEAFDLDAYAVGEWKPGTRKDVCIKLASDHDSADAAFSDAWQDLSDIREYIKGSVVQRSDLDTLTPELDEIRLVTGESRYYQYHWYTPESEDGEQEDVLGWEKLSIRFQPYFFNDGDRDQESIESKFGNLRQSEHGYPIVQQQGNSSAFRTQFTTFAPRLGFYLGDDGASFETSNLSLDYDGDTGLVAKRWRFTLPFLANALPAKRTFKLPASIYYYVRRNKNVLPFRTREGSFIIDSMTATCEKSLFIEVEMNVLKREDNFWEFETGTTPGTGGHTTPDFVPKYIGVTAAGKPYLIDASGKVKNPPAWGGLSQEDRAPQCAIDYQADDKILFVGSTSGMLDIYDLSDLANLRKKSIRIITNGNQIASVRVIRYVNNLGNTATKIFIGSSGSGDNYLYVQPYYSDIANYADGQAYDNSGHKPTSGTVQDVCFADGVFYACTWNGEIMRSLDLISWDEMEDWHANFIHMLVTDTKIYVFDNWDRNFWADRSNPTSWHEFTLTSASGPTCTEAVATTGDKAVCTIIESNDYNQLLWMNSTNPEDSIIGTPGLANNCGGIAHKDGETVVSIIETTGAMKLAKFQVPQSAWSYIVVPEFFKKMFHY
jgi:hypothetical protein